MYAQYCVPEIRWGLRVGKLQTSDTDQYLSEGDEEELWQLPHDADVAMAIGNVGRVCREVELEKARH